VDIRIAYGHFGEYLCTNMFHKKATRGISARAWLIFPLLQILRSSGVVRICCEEGQRLNLCHGALTVDFGAGCSSCSMTNVTNAIGLYWSKGLRVVDICIS